MLYFTFKIINFKRMSLLHFSLAKIEWVYVRQPWPHHDDKLLKNLFGLLPCLAGKAEQNIKWLQNSERARLVLWAVFGEKE